LVCLRAMSSPRSTSPPAVPLATEAPLTLACTMCGLAAALYMIGFFHRVYPAVIGGELMRDFAINAALLGNLSALYFYSYAAMQFPTGVLADRYGPRAVLAVGACVAGIGTLLFAYAGSLVLAGLGRLLVGGAVAVGFVCAIKLASHWMAPQHLTLVTGMAFFLGITGALAAGYPMAVLLAVMDWRWIIGGLGILTLGLALLIWQRVRDDPTDLGYRSQVPVVGGGTRPTLRGNFAAALRNRNVTLLTAAGGALTGSVLAFAGLWGVPFLSASVSIDRETATLYCSAMLLAFAVGGPLLGTLSERIRSRKRIYLGALPASLPVWWVLLLHTPQSPPLLLVLVLLAGLSSGGMVIVCYSHGRESVRPQAAGTVTGLINTGAIAGPMVLQPLIGWLLDRHWDGTLVDGVPVYAASAYAVALSPLLGWLALAAVLLALTRETQCRPAAG
jgi:MFS family permease